MKVGVIGSGAIGPDLAYGFVSAIARAKDAQVFLLDIKQEALDAGMARINGYIQKGVSRGKLAPKAAKTIEAALVPTQDMQDLAECDFVLEAATEDLVTKQAILKKLEAVVRPDCLIGFATSGLPRAQIAAGATHPDRCFVNHPFFPAWRAKPIEVVLSGDAKLSAKMISTLKRLGKVPVPTTDVPCFAADDIFCNYCAEAARLVAEGTATPAQVDAIVNSAIGGGGPFNVMDLTRGNLLNAHCLELMKDAPTGSDWFTPPPIFRTQANTPWHDRKNPGDPSHDEALRKEVLDRILAVLISRTYFVVDNGICTATELNWLTREALGFKKGLLELAEDLGVECVHDICTAYAARFAGFHVPESIASKTLPAFYQNLLVDWDNEIAIVSLHRPEAMNALNTRTLDELEHVFTQLEGDANVKGVVLTSYAGAIAGADINELAVLHDPEAAKAKALRGQAVLNRIAAMSKPVVAAVNGAVLGGGAELSMACHARVVGPGLMWGQPEVNLGVTPGYGGTQRLPRLIGLDRALDLLRTGRPMKAQQACEWGWATGEPSRDFLGAALDLLRSHLKGDAALDPVKPEPMTVPDDLPRIDIGQHSLAVDAILIDILRRGLVTSLDKGLVIEAEGFGACVQCVDFDIGMKNFIQNGPRVPAMFMNE
jgi:enoyl-CoA hydratase/3-hydroxyacyl-CoA dehydrogenase